MSDMTDADLIAMEDDFIKSYVKGHMRGSHYVRPYNRDGGAHGPDATHHPKVDDDGKKVLIHKPHHPSHESTWHEPEAVATFVPGGDVPARLNGVSFTRWRDHPKTVEGWDFCDGIMQDLDEPPFKPQPGKSVGAGVVIREPDGRVWITHPTNQYGGYMATFAKGTADPELSLQANALREAWEETGLKIRIVGFIGDFSRTTSVARMYLAERVGGTPQEMGWETQALSLAPPSHLYEHLNGLADHPIAEAIGAGPAPKKAEPPPQTNKPHFGGLFGKK